MCVAMGFIVFYVHSKQKFKPSKSFRIPPHKK